MPPVHRAVAWNYIDGVVAAHRDNPECLDSEDQYGLTPLQLAVQCNHVAVAAKLLELGAVDMDRPSRVIGGLPLVSAVRRGCDAMVKLLIDNGVNINGENEDGTTALLAAINTGNLAMVNMLLAANANVE